MLERAPHAWGHTGELQRFTCLGWPGERLRRLLLGGRGLELSMLAKLTCFCWGPSDTKQLQIEGDGTL